VPAAPQIARVVDEPLSVAEHEDAVADKAAGAVVSFAGVSGTTTAAGR